MRGLYTAASGLQVIENRMDVASNNLANVDLVGFKRDIIITKSFPEMLIRRVHSDNVMRFPMGNSSSYPILGNLGTGVEFNEIFTSFEQGSLKHTEGNFDFALGDSGSSQASFGFFVIETPHGERYTRNGNFVLGKEGYLVTKNGYRVLGESGPLKIKLHNFKVDSDGLIWHNPAYDNNNPTQLTSQNENRWEKSEVFDRIKIVHFLDIVGQPAERYLQKRGNSMWATTEFSREPIVLEAGNVSRPRILQGFLEASTVNAVKEMINLITINRSYEACQKVTHTHDVAVNLSLDRILRTKI